MIQINVVEYVKDKIPQLLERKIEAKRLKNESKGK